MTGAYHKKKKIDSIFIFSIAQSGLSVEVHYIDYASIIGY